MTELILAVALTVGVTASAAMYVLPLIIGVLRRVPDIGSVAAVNILLGWTLIGWAAAMAMALRSAGTRGPAIQIVQYLPAASPLPALPPPAEWAGRSGGWAGQPGQARRPGLPPLVLPPPQPGFWDPDPDSFGEPRAGIHPGGFREPPDDMDPDRFRERPDGTNPGGFQEPEGRMEPDAAGDPDWLWSPGGVSGSDARWMPDGSWGPDRACDPRRDGAQS